MIYYSINHSLIIYRYKLNFEALLLGHDSWVTGYIGIHLNLKKI